MGFLLKLLDNISCHQNLVSFTLLPHFLHNNFYYFIVIIKIM